MVHKSRHLYDVPPVVGHLQIAHKDGICNCSFAKASANLLDGVLQSFLFLPPRMVDKQRELLWLVFGYEFDGTNGHRSDFRSPFVMFLERFERRPGDLRGNLRLKRQLALELGAKQIIPPDIDLYGSCRQTVDTQPVTDIL